MRTLTATTKVFAYEYSGIGPKELETWEDEQLADRLIYSRTGGNMDGWTQIGTATVSVTLFESEQVIACAVEGLKASGYQIVAVELTDDAAPYHQFDYAQKVALVVGHEDHGVTKATLAACDAAVFVPMYGKGLSLNVHVALAVVLYHIRHSTPSN